MSNTLEEERASIENPHDSVPINVAGLDYMVRFPKPERKFAPILKEYEGIGFLSLEGTLRPRNHQQQIDLIDQAKKVGVHIPKPLLLVENNQVTQLEPIAFSHAGKMIRAVAEALEKEGQKDAIVYPFVPGIALNMFLAEETSSTVNSFDKKKEAVELQLRDLQRSHRANLVMGDRWGPNQIVVETRSKLLALSHIDIDLDISQSSISGKFNPHAVAFEAAQVLYHLAYWTNSEERARMIEEVIAPGWKKIAGIYQAEIILYLLEGHQNFFRREDPEYGFDESNLLLEKLKT